jgi:hypothetical protein
VRLRRSPSTRVLVLVLLLEAMGAWLEAGLRLRIEYGGRGFPDPDPDSDSDPDTEGILRTHSGCGFHLGHGPRVGLVPRPTRGYRLQHRWRWGSVFGSSTSTALRAECEYEYDWGWDGSTESRPTGRGGPTLPGPCPEKALRSSCPPHRLRSSNPTIASNSPQHPACHHRDLWAFRL